MKFAYPLLPLQIIFGQTDDYEPFNDRDDDSASSGYNDDIYSYDYNDTFNGESRTRPGRSILIIALLANMSLLSACCGRYGSQSDIGVFGNTAVVVGKSDVV